MKLPKELIKEIVRKQKFTSTNQIIEMIKEMFSDILEEVLQCEMDEQLGYEKHQRRSDEPSNYRNGSTKRKLILLPNSMELGSLFNFLITNTPLALHLLFYQIKKL